MANDGPYSLFWVRRVSVTVSVILMGKKDSMLRMFFFCYFDRTDAPNVTFNSSVDLKR